MRQLQLEAEEHRKQKKRQNVSGLHRSAGSHSARGAHTVSTASPGFRESVPGRRVWGRVATGTSTQCLGTEARGWDRAPGGPGNVPLP